MTAERVQLKNRIIDFDKIMIKGCRCNKKVMFIITFYLIKACFEGFTPHPFVQSVQHALFRPQTRFFRLRNVVQKSDHFFGATPIKKVHQGGYAGGDVPPSVWGFEVGQ
jgi:hypothetical protein